MNYISISYAVLYELDFATEYKFTKTKECFNGKTGRKIKQVYKNRCIGYNIRGKFYSLTRLKKHLVKPKKVDLPF
tara:strand:+ start:46 stop:270 length:225 start_codon:yes stop_codon:yes gene_type:complete